MDIFIFIFKNLFLLDRFGIMTNADDAADSLFKQLDTNQDGRYRLGI